MVKLVDLVVNKLLSGRFLMTVAFTFTGCYMAAKNMLPSEAFVGILTLVAREYFARTDREPNKETTNGLAER